MSLRKNIFTMMCGVAISSLPALGMHRTPTSRIPMPAVYGGAQQQPVAQDPLKSKINLPELRQHVNEASMDQGDPRKAPQAWQRLHLAPQLKNVDQRYTARPDATFDDSGQTQRQAATKKMFASGVPGGLLKPTRLNLGRATKPESMSRSEALRTLNLTESATKDQIKTTYKQAALKAHPDTGGTHKQFLKVKEAFEVLTEKREEEQEREQARQERQEQQKQQKREWQEREQAWQERDQPRQERQEQRKQQKQQKQREQQELYTKNFIKGGVITGLGAGAAYSVNKYMSQPTIEPKEPQLYLKKSWSSAWFGTKPSDGTVWDMIENKTNNKVNRNTHTYKIRDDGNNRNIPNWQVDFTKK